MTKERIYLDYNATSPLSKKSLEFLDSGDFYFANPASQHRSGKSVSKKINLVKDELIAYFNLDLSYDVLFHSGATEGMNTFFNLEKGDSFIYSNVDHSLVESIAKILDARGVEVLKLKVNSKGMLNIEDVISQIKQRNSKGSCLMNYTWMNNETGVIWNLEDAERIKRQCQIYIHVDAVQTPGKIFDYKNLNPGLDSYTYSGHKFGAFKGIGFSFFKRENPPKALIHGGGQQGQVRSGTLNTYGVFSLLGALRDQEAETFTKIGIEKERIEKLVNENSNLFRVENLSNNTICLIHKTKRADVLFIHFDMAGLDVSMGSACSSGSTEESHVLLAMGYEGMSQNSIRLSLGELSLKPKLFERLTSVIGKL